MRVSRAQIGSSWIDPPTTGDSERAQRSSPRPGSPIDGSPGPAERVHPFGDDPKVGPVQARRGALPRFGVDVWLFTREPEFVTGRFGSPNVTLIKPTGESPGHPVDAVVLPEGERPGGLTGARDGRRLGAISAGGRFSFALGTAGPTPKLNW